MAFGAPLGCDDTDTPSELVRPQILAVRSEPPALLAGERGRLRVLVGTSTGGIMELDPSAAALTTTTGAARLAQEASAWFVVAGDAAAIDAARQAAGLAATAAVPVELQLSVAIEGFDKLAVKTIGVGLSAANPLPPTFTVNGMAPGPDGVVAVVGVESQLTATAQGGTGALGYSWYSSVGKLGRYRSPTATLKATATTSGLLLAVVRDEAGGVSWASIAARVDPAAP
jgi:hypothetical protein